MTEPLKGLRLDIYRGPYGDGSNGGISGRGVQGVTLVGILDKRRFNTRVIAPLTGDSRGPFTVSDEMPPVILVYRDSRVNDRPTVHVEPYDPPMPTRIGWMAGGTFLDGDSRFSTLAGFYGAVAFHDRQE